MPNMLVEDLFKNGYAFEANLGAASLTKLCTDKERLSQVLDKVRNMDRDTVEADAVVGTPEISATETEMPQARHTPVQLPCKGHLRPTYENLYKLYDLRHPDQHWGTKKTVLATINLAYNWWRAKKSPKMLIGHISAKDFGATGGHRAHKTGTHVDIDLAGVLPQDTGGTSTPKNQLKCAIVCWFAIRLGFRRGLFGDRQVCEAVNRLAKQEGLSGRMAFWSDHKNHFHFEMPLESSAPLS